MFIMFDIELYKHVYMMYVFRESYLHMEYYRLIWKFLSFSEKFIFMFLSKFHHSIILLYQEYIIGSLKERESILLHIL